ncbi:MAG: glycosyltransferase family 39 protein [Myxococcota bacterium]
MAPHATRELRHFALALLAATAWVSLVRPGPLDLPYWWDEADVYVPGSKWVAENDLTVTPGVFPDDYSRGHPILLYWIAGAAFRAFGPEPTTGHLVVLPFTVLALVFTYLLGSALFDRRTGVGAALLLATTPLFLSIGNVLLPEIPLTALAVMSLYAYARGRLGWAVVLGCAAVWIKETGVFSVAAIAGAELWMALRGRRRHHLKRFLIASLPVLALVGFFVWQKVHAGYFVFPHHANLFADRPLGLDNLATVWPSLLFWHGRWIAVVGALLVLAFARSWPQSEAEASKTREATVVAIVLLVLANFVFFSKMFWLERYALPAHPGIVVLLGAALLWGIERLPNARQVPRMLVVAAACALGFAGLYAPTEPDAEEQTFAYADAIEAHQQSFAPILAQDRDPVVLTPWPMQIELRYPYLGYVERPVQTIHPRNHEGADFDFVLFGTHSWRADELRELARERGLRHRHTTQVGVAQPMELWGP